MIRYNQTSAEVRAYTTIFEATMRKQMYSGSSSAELYGLMFHCGEEMKRAPFLGEVTCYLKPFFLTE
ncbi:hypothetical protein ACHQM5_002318 [Ranunculus cassubicifolius]